MWPSIEHELDIFSHGRRTHPGLKTRQVLPFPYRERGFHQRFNVFMAMDRASELPAPHHDQYPAFASYRALDAGFNVFLWSSRISRLCFDIPEGRSGSWRKLIEKATGLPLTPRHYLEQFLR